MTVLVVGAGPVGLMMALELAVQGIPVRIIDKKHEISPESRAAGVHTRTLEALDRLDMAERFVEKGWPIHALNIFSHKKQLLKVDLGGLPSKFPFVLTLGQDETEKLLLERLRELGIEVEYGVELLSFVEQSDGVEAKLSDDKSVRASYLIGCDGAHSTVREALHIPFAGGDYHQHFVWCDAEISWPLPLDEAGAYLNEHAGMFVLPLSQTGHARIVFAFFDETHYSQDVDIDHLVQLLGPEGMTLSNPQFLNHFFVHHRIVTHYRKGRVFLAGDSAHIHSPVGGQGMNTGMQDATNLAWKLALVLKDQASDALLDTYQAERHPIGQLVVKEVDVATKLITMSGKTTQKLRDRIVTFVGHLKPVQERLIAGLSETSVHYPSSPIVAEEGTFFTGGPKAGDRAPHFGFPRHQLVLFCGIETRSDLSDKFQEAQERFGDFADVHLVTLPEQNLPHSIVDADGSLHEVYGALDETLYLIRPDGYVGYRSQPADLDWLNDYISDKLFLKAKKS